MEQKSPSQVKFTENLKFVFFQKFLLGMFLTMSYGVLAQVNITPERSAVSGFPLWTDTNIVGTTYIQLLVAGANTITPEMNFDNYTNETLDFQARTFGAVTAGEHVITVSISVDNGVNWTVLGTRTPASNIPTDQTQFDLSAYSGTQVKIRFSVAGVSNTIGVGILNINIKGNVPTCTIPTFSFPSSSITKNVGDGNFTQTATSSSSGAITYSSSDSSVASVNATTGQITVGSPGTATITATQAASSPHCAATTTYTITVNSTSPTINTTGTLAAFSTTYGTASATQNFTFSAINLTGSTVTATAPAGFEVSSSSGGPFGSTATYTVTSGNASGTVYVRLAGNTAAGTHSGAISFVDDTNSATATKAIPNSTVNPKALTISGITALSKTYDGTTNCAVVENPQYVGLENSEAFSVSGTVNWIFSTKNVGATLIRIGSYNVPSANYTVVQPNLSASITQRSLSIGTPLIESKVYDGSVTTGPITPGTISNLIGTETLTISSTGTYSDANAGTGKPAIVSYSLANGNNGGLAINYSLATGTGTGDITKANPVFTTTTISVNVGGTQTIAGSISNSPGAMTFVSSNNSIATVNSTGLVTGVTLGFTTITISQAISTNFNAGNGIVTVNITDVAYVAGDYRSTTSGFWNPAAIQTSAYAKWDRRNSSGGWDLNVAPPAVGTANSIYIENGHVVTSGTSYGNAVKIKVLNGGKFVHNNSGTAHTVYIYDGGTFEFNNNLLNISTLFEIENGGTFIYAYNANPGSGIALWNGKEVFHENSNFIVKDHKTGSGNFFLPPAGNSLGSAQISSNNYNGINAYFGNLKFESTNEVFLTNTNLSGSSLYLTHRDFEITSPTNYRLIHGDGTWIIGRDLIVNGPITTTTGANTILLDVKRNFVRGGTGAYRLVNNATANVTMNVAGNIEVNSGSVEINATNGGSGVINLKGDLYVSPSSILTASNGTTAAFNFNGIGDGTTQESTQTIDVANTSTTSNIVFNVNNGAYAKIINQNLRLGANSKFNVLSNGTLNFGYNASNTALNISGNGTTGTGFASQSTSTLIITSPQGIMGSSGSFGNIQTNTAPSISQDANFYYVGKENQITGSGLSASNTAKNVYVNLENNTLELRLSNPVQISSSGKLEIQKGIVFGEEAGLGDKDFSGLGKLIMTDGEYRISTIASNPSSDLLPQLSGTYSLSGGTVTLDGSDADQVLRNGRVYHNLKIAGTNTLLSNAKKVIVNSGVTVTNQLYITENAIFDSHAHAVGGNANVIMDANSRWRNSRTTATQPELTGTYSLTGGTIEFYGTTASTNQTVKGGIIYNNIDVNADAINSNYTPIDNFYNVNTSSSITVAGNLNVNSPAAFKIGSTHNISGTGNILINPGATLLYGSENGIKNSGTGTGDGAIRVSGTRNFSPLASYGFIGGQSTMASGNGLPTSVENLYIARTNGSLDVSLTNPSLSIKNNLVMLSGNIVTENNTITLGTDATNKGTLEYTSGFVKGKLTRWFAGSNSGDATSLFPLGTSDNKNRFAKIEFNTATAGGTLTASVDATPMGDPGIAAIPPIPAVSSCSIFNVVNTEDFFWNIIPSGVSGTFTASLTRESASTDPICEMTLLKRDATNWEAPGTHLVTSGTSSMATVSRSGLTNFKDFGFGFKRCIPTTWNGIAWSNGTPTRGHSLTFDADYTSNGNVVACECQINPGKSVTVLHGHTLEIYGNLSNSGTLTIEDSGSLVQHDDFASNTGKIIMKRDTDPMYRYDFTYWSSPLTQASGYKLADPNLATPSLSPATLWDKYYFWNAASQAWNVIPNGNEVMVPGKGYILRAPQNYSTNPATTTVYQAIFEGYPGNGIVNAPISTSNGHYNLIGNPYPSAVSADLFLSDALNSNVLDGTIYLWTHNSPPSTLAPGDNTYNYTSSDYASYNFSGGVGTAATSESSASDNVPMGYVGAGQSFFVKSVGGGNATFKNSMRVVSNNNQFFRTLNTQQAAQSELEKHRVWLNISNDQGAFNQALVGYIENASNGLERGFDGEVLGGNYVSLYSIAANTNLVIQGRELPFNVQDKVDLGFKVTIAGSFRISIDHFDGLFGGQNIYLEDKLLDVIHDLKQSPYDFVASIGTFDTRFVLRYTNETLGAGEYVTDANNVIVFVKDKTIKAISSKENMESIAIYDLLGRLIYANKNVHAMNFSTSEITANQQALIVKIKLENGQKVDKKIIYN